MKATNNQNRQGVLSIIAVVILFLFVMAMFSGSADYDNHADFDVTGSIRNGSFVHNDWFSAEVCDVNKSTARGYGVSPKTKGIIVMEIDGNNDVMSKVRVGDVITGINNEDVHNLKDFRKVMGNVNPAQGLFLDIERNGYPMFVSLNGANVAGTQRYDVRNPDPYSINDIAPFMGRGMQFGAVDVQSGVVGQQIEKWVESNIGRGYHTCPSCGTLVPSNANTRNTNVYCPNCNTQMINR